MIAVFGMSLADQRKPWPKRGTASRDLVEREGWRRETIVVPTKDGNQAIEAMVHLSGTLAVHPMVGGDEGFATSLAVGGLRLSCGGSVFLSCDAAMDTAEKMDAAREDWPLIALHGFNAGQKRTLADLIEAAEWRGEILLDRVWPS